MRPNALPPEALLPHRGAMLLLERVLGADEHQAVALARIAADSPFATRDGVPAAIALEYLAQTAAAFFTLRALNAAAHGPQAGPAPAPGMLVRCQSLTAPTAWLPRGVLLLHSVVDSPLRSAQPHGLVRFLGRAGTIDSAPDGAAPDAGTTDALADHLEDGKCVTARFSVYLPPQQEAPGGSKG